MYLALVALAVWERHKDLSAAHKPILLVKVGDGLSIRLSARELQYSFHQKTEFGRVWQYLCFRYGGNCTPPMFPMVPSVI